MRARIPLEFWFQQRPHPPPQVIRIDFRELVAVWDLRGVQPTTQESALEPVFKEKEDMCEQQ